MSDMQREPRDPAGQSMTALMELAKVIESKDVYTGGHTWRVAGYGRLLAERLGYDRDYARQLHDAGTLHDLGKIMIPTQVLNKRGRLTDPEFQLIRRHPLDGFDLLKYEPMFTGLLDVVLYHHEAVNGSGYPAGLKGDQIPEMARLFAVVDAFDAITSTRPYSQGRPVEQAIDLLLAGRGEQFNGAMVDCFVSLCRDGAIDGILGNSGPGYALGECSECGPIIDVQSNHGPGEEITCRGCGRVYRIVELKPGVTRLEFGGRIDADAAVLSAAHLPGGDPVERKTFWRCLGCGQVGLDDGELPDGCPECHAHDGLLILKS